MMMEQTKGRVRAVSKAMELIEALCSRRAPMALQELSTAVGYPKSTVHALLITLRDHAMVAQLPDGRYTLGIRLFECGNAVSESWDIPQAVHPILEKLSIMTHASAFFSLLEDSWVISLDKVVGSDGIQIVPEVGCRLPAHATSQGKVLLAQLSDAEVEKRLQHVGMPPFTPHTITDMPAFLAGLAVIRQRGYAVEDGEYKIGMRSVSAPVTDSTGQVRFALGVVGLFRRVSSDEFQSAVSHVAAMAERLSDAL